MRLREIQPGILRIKQGNMAVIVIGIIMMIAGLIYFFSNIDKINFSTPEIYITIVLIGLGALLTFLTKIIITTIDKNQNIIKYEEKKIKSKKERRILFAEVKEILYQERLGFSNTGSRGSKGRTGMNTGGTKPNIEKTISLALKTGELLIVYSATTSYNPFFNRTKDSAQRLADTLGVPLKSGSVEDTIKNIGNNLFGKNNNPGQI